MSARPPTNSFPFRKRRSQTGPRRLGVGRTEVRPYGTSSPGRTRRRGPRFEHHWLRRRPRDRPRADPAAPAGRPGAPGRSGTAAQAGRSDRRLLHLPAFPPIGLQRPPLRSRLDRVHPDARLPALVSGTQPAAGADARRVGRAAAVYLGRLSRPGQSSTASTPSSSTGTGTAADPPCTRPWKRAFSARGGATASSSP